jgi:cytidyltransferase-like protein
MNNFIKKIQDLKRKNKKIGMVHGVFDVVHVGHIIHFLEAKKKVDFLIASVTSDKYVNKAPGKPIFSVVNRIKVLENLRLIDLVIESNSKNALKNISLIKPDFYFKGTEYKDNKDITNNIKIEKEYVKKFGGKIIFTEGQIYSSSKILNEKFNFISKTANNFIKKINLKKFKENLFNFKNIKEKILIIGDPIIDIYKMVVSTGRSNKAPIISSRFLSEESYGGGTILIANFLKKFCEEVCILYSSNKNNNKIINNFLDPKIKKIKFKSKINFVEKIRFVEYYSKTKLFQNTFNEDKKLNNLEIRKLKKFFSQKIKNFDKIFIFDFGYNFFPKELINIINLNPKKFIINCQSNSYNFGFNIPTKFSKGSIICMDELEYRLCVQEKSLPINELIKKNLNKFNRFDQLIITEGKVGCYVVKNKKIYFIPSFFKELKDATGCGDIFLSAYGLANITKTFNIHECAIIAHIAAGIHGTYFGNKNVVDYKNLIKVSDNILK